MVFGSGESTRRAGKVGVMAAVTSRPSDAIGPLTSVGQPPRLTQFAETLCSQDTVGQLRQVCDRWLYSSYLHFVLPEEQRVQSGFRYEYSLYQVEYSHNLLFQRGQQMEQVFDGLIERTRTWMETGVTFFPGYRPTVASHVGTLSQPITWP